MGHLTARRLLKCLAVPLLVAQVGCAARKVEVAPAAPAPSVREEDHEACAAFARRQAKGVGPVDSVAGQTAKGFGYGLLFGLMTSGVGAFVGAPIGAIVAGARATHANDEARKYVYSAAEEKCLKPVVLAATLGPEHPDVAVALRDLAIEYAYHEDYRAAQPLYPRALAIQERAFGPESGAVATTLEWYARLLRAMHRDEEATAVETRAQTIRAKAERGPDPAATNGTSARPGGSPTAGEPGLTPRAEGE